MRFLKAVIGVAGVAGTLLAGGEVDRAGRLNGCPGGGEGVRRMSEK